MKRGPRWQIWVPRLLLVGVVALAAQRVLGLVARSVVIRSAQTALGVPIEIEHSRVAIGERRVLLGNLRFGASPQAAGGVVAADLCELELETQPLLYKQVVAKTGCLSGLQFDAARIVSTTTGEPDASSSKWFRDDSDLLAAQWFSHVAEHLHQNRAARLESEKQAEMFLANWSRACLAIDAEGYDLDRQAAAIQGAVEANETNPLRSVTFLAELPQTVAELQKKFTALCRRLEGQAEQLEQERRAIVAARRRDEQAVAKPLALERVSADAVTAYLLRRQATTPLNQVSDLLRWARATWPKTTAGPASRGRGEDILFAGCAARPNFLIRTLELQGTARHASRPVELRGVLTGFSSSPAVHNGPMQLRLSAAGSTPLELQATIDRTRGALRDSLRVDAEGIWLPAAKLGRADQFAVMVEPSAASLFISVSAHDDQLAGEIHLVQRDVRMVAAVGDEFADIPLAQALNESLEKVNFLATRISLAGTLQEPKCTLRSNLGPAVAEAMQRAAERAGNQRARALLAQAAHMEDEQLTTVERHICEQQARWNARMATIGEQLQKIAAAEQPSQRLSPDRVGRQLPAGSLFR